MYQSAPRRNTVALFESVGYGGNDERQIEKDLFTLAIGDFIKIPVLIQIPFIPLKAFTMCDDVFHCVCILQPYTHFVKVHQVLAETVEAVRYFCL